MSRTDIQNFYANSVIFLTGGTGFLGKLLLEKILRSCSDVKQVYVLARSKKDESPQRRFEKIFDSPIFELIKQDNPNVINRVQLVEGDCKLANLGLSTESIKQIQRDVNIIIHCAATVRFDARLIDATVINIKATRDLLEIAKKCPQLKAFVHVSTAYSNCNRTDEIKEKVYKPPIQAQDLMLLSEALDEEIFNTVVQKAIIKDWPNTYTVTKNITEDLVKKNAANLPVIIIRPSIITSTADEPIKGFMDNFYGPSGLVLGIGLGLIRVARCKRRNKLNVVPCDYVSNMILTAAWYVANDRQEPREVKVVHCVNKDDKIKPLDELHEMYIDNLASTTSIKAIWYPYVFKAHNDLNFRVLHFLLHILPAFLVDLASTLAGKHTNFVELYRKVDKMNDVLRFFAINSWKWEMTNQMKLTEKMSPEDRVIFNFDVNKFEINSFFLNYIMGLRLYLAEDPIETHPEALKKRNRLRIYHYISIAAVVLLLLIIVKFFLYIFGY